MKELDLINDRLKRLETYEIRVKNSYVCYSTYDEILNQVHNEMNELRERKKKLEKRFIKCI